MMADVDVAKREKDIQDAVSQIVNTWSRAAVIALMRQIRLCEPHWPSVLVDLDLMYRKEVKRPELKQFQE